ncbi:uncharacterized protein PV09_02008 [Verruconis gallopava]|uniref:Inner kinetochore subunit AME1 domain-containing protein n=1 Tax=Verruconis gallopava TaxID=253628 RepID=A0A0D1XWI7_9PEZI|nr:uncharacterized protein PV09_02008 [Verruconis gallopava]KIW07136.1 hypothetical protein PV09_02008 [Verruconis gallopava]
MAPQEKQERRLARQRGAGPRELKNASFSFSFGVPALQSQPTRDKTPQPRQSQPQRTPAAHVSTGKRKREAPASRLSAAHSAKKAKTPLVLKQSDELDELSPEVSAPIDKSELPQLRRVSIPILPLNKPLEQRPPESPDRRPPREERGRSRTRKSIVSLSYSLSRSRLDTLTEGDEAEIADSAREADILTTTTRATPSTQRRSVKGRSTSRRSSSSGPFDGGTSSFLRNQAAQSTRREKLEIPNDGTHSEDELTPAPMKVSRKTSQVNILADTDADGSGEDGEQDELSPQQDATTNESIASGRTPLTDRSTNTTRPPLEKGKRDQDETSEPVRKKQKTATSEKSAKTTSKGGAKIPITVYKRTKLAEDDPLGIDPDPIPSLNASDVLSQISTEIINAYISNVPDVTRRSTAVQSKSSVKKTMLHQMQALQQFRDNLSDALRSITFAQYSFYKFSGEVRRMKKRKRELRAELIARRKEREEIEIEIDRVRSQHLERESVDEKTRKLIDDIESIEEAIRRGRSRESADERPEVGFLATAEEIGNRVGVLKRINEFNAFLARAAEAL